MNKEKFKRKCPQCNTELTYSSKCNLIRSINKNSICCLCSNRNKVLNPLYIQKLSQSKLGNKNPMKRIDVRLKVSLATKGIPKHTEEFKQRVSNRHKGKITSNYTKQKMREAVLKKIEKYGKYKRNFNPQACIKIEEYGKNNGYNFQHAMNGGEIIIIGYSLDGYDAEKNVVFEYDENGKNHFDKNGNLKEKDIKRMNEIISSLHCKFIRYNERKNTINEYNTT
jgi:hypothetical protein